MTELAKSIRFLVIDDDDVDRMAVRRVLKQLGMDGDVREATDGTDGLAVLTDETFDCVLLDFQLPDMNGIDFLAALSKKIGNDSPAVIMLTGEGDESIAVNAMKSGAQDYLVKNAMSAEGLYRTVIGAIERVSLQREIVEKHIEIERSNRAKSEFVAMMSHELRTPLNAIIGFAQVMKDELQGPIGNSDYENYIEHIFDCGHHLLDLINDILDLSKIEAGKHEIEVEAIDVAEIVDRCMAILKTRAEENGVEVGHEISRDIPELNADKRKLKQILLNLLSNAIKFTPAGGRVEVKAWANTDGGFVIQVIDTGVGIALADIPRALSLFDQIDNSLTRKFIGTGLGLPLSKSLVELHGGSLDLQSAVDVGTTVTLRFPAARIVAADSMMQTSAA